MSEEMKEETQEERIERLSDEAWIRANKAQAIVYGYEYDQAEVEADGQKEISDEDFSLGVNAIANMLLNAFHMCPEGTKMIIEYYLSDYVTVKEMEDKDD